MATYECSLQGLIVGLTEKNAIMERLVGICGNDSMIDLFQHEIVFSPTVQTPVGPARNDDAVLRLQSRINSEHEKSFKNRQWYLCMQGHPEPQRGRTVSVRPHVRVELSGDVFRYMKSLGYSYSFEVVRKGHLLAYERLLRITVSQVYKLKTKVDVSSAIVVDEDIWMIEVNSTPVPQEQVNQMAEQLNKFKLLLNGIVDLEYVDTRALQNKIHYT
ncbi:mediator complex, subunit Med18 [Circinella umbellata]|nr:mediator complex, subunit Med18 [Circinella umbellata]